MIENSNPTTKEEELYEHYRFVVDPKQSPIRLDKFLLGKIVKISRNKIQNAIKAAAITVDGKKVKPNFKVKPHQVVLVLLPRPPIVDEAVKGEDIPLDIRYEDDDLLVVYKPAGLVVHPGVGNWTGTLVNGLVHYFQQMDLPLKAGNQADRPGLVHRIDKDTSGLLVIAKNELAMAHLAKQFFDHTVKREYYAIVWGQPKEAEGRIETKIGRNPKNRFQQYAFEEENGLGKHAITHYKVIEAMYYVSLIACHLETGRTHQIRVHMKYIGHPLFNDAKYGGDKILKGTVYTKYKQFVENCFKLIPRQALHAKSLGFIHPTTGEEMFFETQLPEDFKLVLDKWRKYLNNRKSHM
ncbi:MAG TPA: RluA family pseudouridine synthase [Saprospiraceae bacterium]|nr:RluA family pseudouridine synthase [Saprospiraceae bacterium]